MKKMTKKKSKKWTRRDYFRVACASLAWIERNRIASMCCALFGANSTLERTSFWNSFRFFINNVDNTELGPTMCAHATCLSAQLLCEKAGL